MLDSSSPYLQQADSLFCQFNPSNYGVIAEVRDAKTRPATITHFPAMSDRLELGEYRLIELLPDRFGKITDLWIAWATSRFGVPQPMKFKKTKREMEPEWEASLTTHNSWRSRKEAFKITAFNTTGSTLQNMLLKCVLRMFICFACSCHTISS